jgi:hypothetical protein
MRVKLVIHVFIYFLLIDCLIHTVMVRVVRTVVVSIFLRSVS